ncbi:MAG: acyl--CoA ligase [Deltaproteobacteria bacterium]|nr:acyl--CoA ligase [Deltaproteobacteria bacterium]
MTTGAALVARATASTVASLFVAAARRAPDRLAIDHMTYRAVADRVGRLAGALAARGAGRGTRALVLSENRAEVLELYLAAASLGMVVAAPGWRLAAPELAHCVALVGPSLVFASPRHAARLPSPHVPIVFGDDYEAMLAEATPRAPDPEVDPEDPLLVLFTSGTTGLPKGAVVSHRAQIHRNLVVRAEFGIAPEDTFAAWSPLSHMGAADQSLGALMSGGRVVVIDGFDRERLAELVATEPLGWLILMPGMIAGFADELERRGVRPRGVKLCGVMADLVPPAEIARITTLLAAPFANTFGATETGCPPCSSSRIPVGVAPTRLSKEQSPFCEVRLVDPDDRDVPDGEPGELAFRGPTLFSGYLDAEDTNRHDFRSGWFHMGDVFVRHPDGSLDFVDRKKYLIKSGGENIYPAEIERVLLADPRVADAAVVRQKDARWGEVPVAFVAARDASLTEDDLRRRCRAELAGFKQPKAIRFIPFEAFPRSASGKIQRHELERLLEPPAGEEPR